MRTRGVRGAEVGFGTWELHLLRQSAMLCRHGEIVEILEIPRGT